MKKLLSYLKEHEYKFSLSENKVMLVFSAAMMATNVLFYFVLTPRWASGGSQFGPSPQFVPNLLTVAMFICAAFIFAQELIQMLRQRKAEETAKATPAEPKASEAEGAETESKEKDYFDQLVEAAKKKDIVIDLIGLGYVLAAVAAVVFYVLCVNFLGFILTMAIIVSSLMLLYGVRKPLTIIIATLVMSVGIYFAFTKLLALVLPVGQIFLGLFG